MATDETTRTVTQGEGFRTITLRPELKQEGISDLQEVNMKDRLRKGYRLENHEAWSDENQVVMSDRYSRNEHGFVQAVRYAYDRHIPLSFSPDHLWNVILQGVSEHISLNAEELRSHFVNFDGKQTLKIRRDGFTKGSPDNDWAGCFDEWVEQIESFVGENTRQAFCPEFSTTDILARACTNVGFMDAMKSYFDYCCMTMCGIKAVKLLGTEDDWLLLQERVEGLRQYDLDWWIDVLSPTVDNIVKSFKGEEIPELFWESIYKHYSARGSGSVPTVDGWITHFFPYVNGKKRTDFDSLETIFDRAVNPPQIQMFGNGPGMKQVNIPNGIAKTPFDWNYFGNTIKMEFHSGFVGAKFDEDGFITPVQFWAVAEKIEEQKRIR